MSRGTSRHHFERIGESPGVVEIPCYRLSLSLIRDMLSRTVSPPRQIVQNARQKQKQRDH